VREVEADVLPTCQRPTIAVIPCSPLAGGYPSGKWRKGVQTPSSSRAKLLPDRYELSQLTNQCKLEAADALGVLAVELEVSLVHLALAFVIHYPTVTSAIIGPRTIEQLES
jgi:aryl-alcohol dehydrogenase-like predicted oxidoreductase